MDSRFADHTVQMIISVAELGGSDNPVGIAAHALEMAMTMPLGVVEVVVCSTRDEDGRVSFRAYWPDGTQTDHDTRLGNWQAWRELEGFTVKVLSAQQAAAHRGER